VKEGRLIIRVVAISKMARRRRGPQAYTIEHLRMPRCQEEYARHPQDKRLSERNTLRSTMFAGVAGATGSSPWVENGLGLLVHRMGRASLLFGSFCVELSKVTQRSKSQESWHPFLGKAARPSSQSLSQARAARERQPSSVTPFALGPDERRIGLRNWRRWL
jgi:hypothetical protein